MALRGIPGITTFSQLGIRQSLWNSLKGLGAEFPSTIQKLTIPSLIKQPDVSHYLAAPTGSGKTLSYILPCLQVGGPFLILVPNGDLVLQTEQVLGQFGKEWDIAYRSNKFSQEKFSRDITVITPNRLRKHDLDLERYDNVIVDELDTILSEGSEELIDDIIGRKSNRFIFVSAIYSTRIVNLHEKHFTIDKYSKEKPRIKLIVEKNTHKSLDNIDYDFQLMDKGARVHNLKKMLKKSPNTKHVIFCNNNQSVSDLAGQLEGTVCSINNTLSAKFRLKILQRFHKKEINVLLTTDVMSNGIDFKDTNVIMYDFPTSTNSFLTRSGRTGRGNQSGICTIFYSEQDEKRIYQIQNSFSKDRPLSVRKTAIEVPKDPKVKKLRGKEFSKVIGQNRYEGFEKPPM